MTIFSYYINYVDIIFSLIIVLFAIFGIKKGLFLSIFNVFRTFFGITLSVYVSNKYSDFFYKNLVKPKLLEQVNKEISNSNNVNDVIKTINDSISEIPQDIKLLFGLDNIALQNSKDISKSIVDSIFEPISILLTKGAIFLVVAIVFFLITGIIAVMIKHKKNKNKRDKNASKPKKAIVTIDGLLGGVLGAAKGLIIVLLFVLVISTILSQAMSKPTGFILEASQSKIYTFLLTFNPFNMITEGIL